MDQWVYIAVLRVFDTLLVSGDCAMLCSVSLIELISTVEDKKSTLSSLAMYDRERDSSTYLAL